MIAWRSIATTAVAAGLVIGFATSGLDDAAPALPAPVVEEGPQPLAVPSLPTVGSATARVVPPHPAVSPPSVTALRTAWNTGLYTSMVTDDAGTTHVAFYDDGTGSVMLASCGDPCTEPTVRVLAGVPGVGTDIVLMGDRVVVSYLDLGTRTVQLVTCVTADCDRVQRRPVASVDAVGPTRLVVTPDGDLVLGYPELGEGVVVLRCDGDRCRDGSRLTLPGAADHFDLAVGDRAIWVASRDPVGRLVLSRCDEAACVRMAASEPSGVFPSLAVGSAGDVFMSYHAMDGHTLRLLSCSAGAACRDVVVDDAGEPGYFSALVLRPSGLPLIAHRSESTPALLVADCRTPDCSVVARNTVDRHGDPGQHLSVAVRSDGTTRIAHRDEASQTLRLTACSRNGCATPPGSEHGGMSVSVALAPDGTPLVAWRHPDTIDLRLSRCLGGPCLEGVGIDSSGDVGLHASLWVGEDRISILYRNARGGLRLLTCDADCARGQVTAIPTTAPVARLAMQPHQDGTTTLVLSRPDGTVEHGHCPDPTCHDVTWTGIGRGRPLGPIAVAAAGPSGWTATAYADPAGAVLVLCDPACETLRFGAAPITAIDVATVGRASIVVSRDIGGQVDVWRCGTTGCRAHSALSGDYSDATVSAGGQRVSVAALTAAGVVEVFDCTESCVRRFELVAPGEAWDLDLHSHADGDTVAVLGPTGPWVAVCDAVACTAEGGAANAPHRRMGHVANQ